ncbi:MAG: hypothetical protein ACLGSA_03885 [Acidobacteriota bacterium]
MAMNRIALKISLPSVALKQFIERVLKDDDFFTLALESPVAAFAEAGVNLRAEEFVPADFAKFFAVLGRLKEMSGGAPREKLNFESIFGQPAHIPGVNLTAETSRGFFRDWGGQQAVTERESFVSTSKEFDQTAGLLREAATARDIAETRLAVADMRMAGDTTETTYKFRSTNLSWDKMEAVQEVGIKTGTTEDFAKDGARIRDLMRGPLIHPSELAAVAARMEAYVDIATGKIRD